MDCTTADASPSAGDYLILQQNFEGQNLQYLKKGTANAVSLTLSFWVKSTKTGTFIAELYDDDNGRGISKSYTVSVSNTWEFKTVTFAGDTTGAFTNDNNNSLSLNFWLGAGTDFTSGTLQTTWASTVNTNRAVGQVNIADSTSNDWLITGIQLEAGTSATDFEFLPYDIDLARCQRYYATNNVGNNLLGCFVFVAASFNTSEAFGGGTFPVFMRTTPTVTVFDDNGTALTAHRAGGGAISLTSVGLISNTGFSSINSSNAFAADRQYLLTYRADAEL